MTASGLSRLPASIAGDFPLPRLTTALRLGLGAGTAVAVIIAALVSGNAATFDPTPVLLFSVVVGAALGGRHGGVAAAAVSGIAALVYFSQPAWVGTPGNAVRVLLFVGSAGLTVALVGTLRDRVAKMRQHSGTNPALTGAVQGFAAHIGDARDEGLLDAVVAAAKKLVDADLVVVTVFDPPSGQHVIRAVSGSASSAVGVEVPPGVGVTGQAIRDRRPVVFGGTRRPAAATAKPGLVDELTALLPSNIVRRGGIRPAAHGHRVPAQPRPISSPQATTTATTSAARPLASVPAMHAGRVVATLTVGRDAGRAGFDDQERLTLDLVAPTLALTVSNWMLRRQLREASIRDSLSAP